MAKALKKTAAGSKGQPPAKAKTRARTRASSDGELKLPRYDELPVRPGAPQGAAWGVFGDDDELGTINLLTPQCVLKATAEIKTGRVFALNLPINIPDPPI